MSYFRLDVVKYQWRVPTVPVERRYGWTGTILFLMTLRQLQREFQMYPDIFCYLKIDTNSSFLSPEKLRKMTSQLLILSASYFFSPFTCSIKLVVVLLRQDIQVCNLHRFSRIGDSYTIRKWIHQTFPIVRNGAEIPKSNPNNSKSFAPETSTWRLWRCHVCYSTPYLPRLRSLWVCIQFPLICKDLFVPEQVV